MSETKHHINQIKFDEINNSGSTQTLYEASCICGWKSSAYSQPWHVPDECPRKIEEDVRADDEWHAETVRIVELATLIMDGVEQRREANKSSLETPYMANRIAQANALANIAIARKGL